MTPAPGIGRLGYYRSQRNELFDFDETSTTISGRRWNWTDRLVGATEFVVRYRRIRDRVVAGRQRPTSVGGRLSRTLTFWPTARAETATDAGAGERARRCRHGRRYQPLSEVHASVVAFGSFQSGVTARSSEAKSWCRREFRARLVARCGSGSTRPQDDRVLTRWCGPPFTVGSACALVCRPPPSATSAWPERHPPPRTPSAL